MKPRVVVLGEHRVGKAAIMERLHSNQFRSGLHMSTNHCDTTIDAVDFEFWKLNYHEASYPLLRKADIAIICLDLSSDIDPEALKPRVDLIKRLAPDANLILLGNKKDIAKRDLTIHWPGIKSDFSAYLPTSAKEGSGIPELRDTLTKLAQALPKLSRDPDNPPPSPANELESNIPRANGFESEPITSGFFWILMGSAVNRVFSFILIIGGILALGLGLTSLFCPPALPLLANFGLILSQSFASEVAIGGGIALMTGLMLLLVNGKAIDNKEDKLFSNQSAWNFLEPKDDGFFVNDGLSLR